ncbi:50S ribosomal protein L29 [candidate division KSB1 bacterium]|nr:MAG: 50S ribosomal protein L29 [candidate division KSB1 bacterium]
MKMDEIRQMPLDEIKIRLEDTEEELLNLQYQLALHQLDNPLKVRNLRKDVARLKTVIREYELGLRQDKKAQS